MKIYLHQIMIKKKYFFRNDAPETTIQGRYFLHVSLYIFIYKFIYIHTHTGGDSCE